MKFITDNLYPVRNIISNGASQTKRLGEKLAKKILKEKPRSREISLWGRLKKRAVIFGLVGDLGGGKTTFLQGFARQLGIKEKVLSPTFVIMKKFSIHPKTYNLKPKTFIHIDCYRVQKPKEILDLGFREIISNPRNIVAIEWAEKVKKILPKETIWLRFEFKGKNKRKITST